jgi:GMP synthase (glutamine-hydrolysing)
MTAHAFGAEAAKDDRPVLGMVKTDVIERDGLFEGLPNPMMLLESRLEVVKSLPTGLRFIARSETSKIAAIKHDRRPLYGVQFHPERYSREHPDGNAVVKNFIRLLWE